MASGRFHVETLGCPKNAVDSEKVSATLRADGLVRADGPEDADLVVVNTCAFVEAARQESIDTILALGDRRKPHARLVVTGCLAERAGAELATALPEVDHVVGFGGEAELAPVVMSGRKPTGVRDLLELERDAPSTPWAYVKVAEGCDRACAFCAIPSFRGPQRSRQPDSVVAEAAALVGGGVSELILVAQDLASYGRDVGERSALVALLRRLHELERDGLSRLRLLYLYPSEVRDPLVTTMLELDTVVPYFDLSLQHAAAPLLRAMRRPGSGTRFLEMIEAIRARQPDAVFRSSFISGFPGEVESHHEELIEFLAAARLDWAGFFPFSAEDGTPAAAYDARVPPEIVSERLVELAEVQEPITAAARRVLIGSEVEVLVDGTLHEPGSPMVGRTWREAPEIDGIVRLVGDTWARPGAVVSAEVIDTEGPDLEATPVALRSSA